jgi:hypothetical protein
MSPLNLGKCVLKYFEGYGEFYGIVVDIIDQHYTVCVPPPFCLSLTPHPPAACRLRSSMRMEILKIFLRMISSIIISTKRSFPQIVIIY